MQKFLDFFNHPRGKFWARYRNTTLRTRMQDTFSIVLEKKENHIQSFNALLHYVL